MREDYIEIVNPTGQRQAKRGDLAERHLENLRGLRVGLLDNNKPNAGRFLQFIGAMLQERYADIELVPKRKRTRMEADGLAELVGRCDVVINAFAD